MRGHFREDSMIEWAIAVSKVLVVVCVVFLVYYGWQVFWKMRGWDNDLD